MARKSTPREKLEIHFTSKNQVYDCAVAAPGEIYIGGGSYAPMNCMSITRANSLRSKNNYISIYSYTHAKVFLDFALRDITRDFEVRLLISLYCSRRDKPARASFMPCFSLYFH